MVLKRQGNKAKIASKIQQYFPSHKHYIDVFFGSGSVFFYKPRAQYNTVNDLDSDVFNLFNVMIKDKQSLYEIMENVPIHEDLLRYWKKNKETEPLLKAARFLFLSNYTLYGAGDTITTGNRNSKQILLKNIEKTYKLLKNVCFMNRDFEGFINSIRIEPKELENTFIYADPPYLYTGDNYEYSFKESDLVRLLDCLEKKKCKFAVSEFDNDFILAQAKQRGLQVYEIGERINIKNRRTEILVTNYKIKLNLFD